MVSMGNVWDRTTEFLSDHLGAILPLALLGIFVPTVLMDNLGALQPGAKPGLALAIGAGTLLLVLVLLWGSMAIIAAALDPANVRSAARLAARRLPMVLLIGLIIGVAFLILTVPVGVIMAVGGADLAAMSAGTMPALSGGAAAALVIYILVVAVVVLWLSARLSVVWPAVIGEHIGLGAIARSWRLTRGVALRIVGVLILYFIVSGIASSAARLGIGSILKLLIGAEPGISIATVLTSIIVAAISTVFTVLYAIFTAKLFVALLIREGGRYEAVRTQ